MSRACSVASGRTNSSIYTLRCNGGDILGSNLELYPLAGREISVARASVSCWKAAGPFRMSLSCLQGMGQAINSGFGSLQKNSQ